MLPDDLINQHNWYEYGRWIEGGISFFVLATVALVALYYMYYAAWHMAYALRTRWMTPERLEEWRRGRLADRIINDLDDMVRKRMVPPSWSVNMQLLLGHTMALPDLHGQKGHPKNHVELGKSVGLPDAKNGKGRSHFAQRLQRIINKRNGFE